MRLLGGYRHRAQLEHIKALDQRLHQSEKRLRAFEEEEARIHAVNRRQSVVNRGPG